MKTKRLTAKQLQAIRMVVEDELTDIQISDQLGVSRTTLNNWKSKPAFSQRVQSLLALEESRIAANPLTSRSRRLRVMSDIHRDLLAVKSARANDGTMADVPGGSTGLLTRSYKQVVQTDLTTGKNIYDARPEYRLDEALPASLARIHQRIVEELGEGHPTLRTQVNVVDQRVMLARIVANIAGPPGLRELELNNDGDDGRS